MAADSSTLLAYPAPATPGANVRAHDRLSGGAPAAGYSPPAGRPGFSPAFEGPVPAEQAPVTPSSRAGQAVATDVYFQGTFGGGAVVRRFIKRLALPQSWPLPAGHAITLQLPPDGRPVRLLVDFCGQLGGRWALFCTFLDIRPSDAVRYFGPETSAT